MPMQRGTLVLAGAAATLAVLEMLRRRRRKNRSLPPGRWSWPMVGETLQYMADPVKFIATGLKEFGGTFRTDILGMHCVVLEPTESNFKFFTKHHDAGWPEHWKSVVGITSVSMVNNPAHKRLRSVYGRSFTQSCLDSYLLVFHEMTRKHLGRWAQWGEARPMRPSIKFYTFEIAQKVILGAEFPEEKTLHTLELFDATAAGLASVVPIDKPGFPFHKIMSARRELVSIYQPMIDSKRAQPPAVPSSMLEHAMASEGQEGGKPSDLELQDFCYGLAFAGHDTTLASMQTMLHFLGLYPDLHAELRAEVDAVWDGQTPVTRELLQKVHKVRAFALEATRSCVPIQAILRYLSADTPLNGWVLPAGTTLMFGTSSVMDAHYPDFDKFDIKRYLDQDGHFIDKVVGDYASVSHFGLGNRMCIGYKFAMDEMFVFLLNLVQGFDFKVEERELFPFPFHSWHVKAQFSVRSAPSHLTNGK